MRYKVEVRIYGGNDNAQRNQMVQIGGTFGQALQIDNGPSNTIPAGLSDKQIETLALRTSTEVQRLVEKRLVAIIKEARG